MLKHENKAIESKVQETVKSIGIKLSNEKSFLNWSIGNIKMIKIP